MISVASSFGTPRAAHHGSRRSPGSSSVTSEALLLILLERRLRKVLGSPKAGSRLAMSAVATASFCLPFAFLPSLPMGIVIPACMLLYSGTLVLFKDIRRSEVPTLMNLVKGQSP